MATQIRVEGTETEVHPANGSNFSLDELYKLTECDCIEIVGLGSGKILVWALRKNLRLNQKATDLYNAQLPIVGTVLVCNSREVQSWQK